MQRYFPRLFSLLSLPVLFWANEALASNAAAPKFRFSTFVSELPTALFWILAILFGPNVSAFLTPLLILSLLSGFLMLLTSWFRKFILKKTSTWADLCWPAALVNLLLFGGIKGEFIPGFMRSYNVFGTELPAALVFIMEIPQVLWFLPFVLAFIYKCIERQPRLSVWLAIQLASLLIIASTVWALFLPIFKIGAVH